MMKRYIGTTLLLALPLLCVSCATTPDVRTRMLNASQRQDPNFPDGNQKKLTQFAYIGDVDANGQALHVVAARSVIPKMLAPRGQAWLAFYDANENFVGAHSIDVSAPLVRGIACVFLWPTK